MEELLQFARQLGHEAGERLAALYGRVVATTKDDGSALTAADCEVDALVHRRIRQRYPDHGILSEESDTIFEGRPITWVIDPLDGTTNYALGIRYWGCSIGLVVDGQPAAGVLVMPLLDAQFWALQGAGAFLNGQRLGGPPRGVTEANRSLTLCSRSWRYFELALPFKGRILGSAAYDLAAVAEGVAVASIQAAPHIWDIAASWVLLREAGRPTAPLLAGAPNPFPLIPGADYQGRIYPLATAADQTTLDRITGAVRLKDSMEARWRAWAAAGWDLAAGRTGKD